MDNFCYVREAIMWYQHLMLNKDEWNTKEDIGKSMKNALYVL